MARIVGPEPGRDTLRCGYIDPKTQVTCGYEPKSGTRQGLSVHMRRIHGTKGEAPPKRRAKAPASAPEENGSAPMSGSHLRRLRAAHADLVLMVQLMYPNGIPTKDPSEVESFLTWVDTTREGLLQRGNVR